MKRIAVLFPGQGSQYVGMGRRLYQQEPAIKELFATASDVLDLDMARLCFEDPDKALNQTENTQPALLLCALAAYRDWRSRTGLTPTWLAGHSLGELTALVAADALSLEDGLKIARQRGLAMARCQGDNAGMSAVTQLDQDRVEALCREVEGFGETLVIANYNAPRQTVLSGSRAALDQAGQLLKKAGATCIPLKVSGPFHSPLMAPAAEELAQALALVELRDPRLPVIANLDARPHRDGAALTEALVGQLTRPVRWRDTLDYLRGQGADLYLETGPRGVLRGLVRATLPGARAWSLDESDDQPAWERELAEDIRTLRERPTVVGRCLAVAVCTPNHNWNEEEYQRGVVEPYRELQALQARLEGQGAEATEGDMDRALELLEQIFTTKGTPEEERRMRYRQILDATGTRQLLGERLLGEAV